MDIFSYQKKAASIQEDLALIERRLATLKEHMTIHRVEVGRISPSPLFSVDETALERLTKSILRFGLIEPLAVRRVSSDDSSLGAVFQLIDGNRRLAAVKKLGLPTVPCCILNIPASDLEAARFSTVRSKVKPDIFDCHDAERSLYEESPSVFHTATHRADDKPDPFLSFSESEREICRTELLDEQMITALSTISDPHVRKQALSDIVRIRRNCLKRTENRATSRGVLGKLLLCDIQPVYNSFERYVRFLRQSGIASSWKREETSDCYRITLEIPKRTYCSIGSSAEPVQPDQPAEFDLRDFAL